MFIPIGDEDSDQKITPTVNYVFIIINVIVFVFLQGFGTNREFTYAFSTVPAEIISGKDIVTEERVVKEPVSGREIRLPGLQETPVSVYITLITAMFMHGGIIHLLGNLLFLYIFGDNIEDKLGHKRYILFYLLCGILASLTHVFSSAIFNMGMRTPTLGASGAISGVLGAYIISFPSRRVKVLLFRIIIEVPALVAIGVWFLFQLISGIGVLGGGSQVGGVAYAAHIGGFVFGLILIKVFAIDK